MQTSCCAGICMHSSTHHDVPVGACALNRHYTIIACFGVIQVLTVLFQELGRAA